MWRGERKGVGESRYVSGWAQWSPFIPVLAGSDQWHQKALRYIPLTDDDSLNTPTHDSALSLWLLETHGQQPMSSTEDGASTLTVVCAEMYWAGPSFLLSDCSYSRSPIGRWPIQIISIMLTPRMARGGIWRTDMRGVRSMEKRQR